MEKKELLVVFLFVSWDMQAFIVKQQENVLLISGLLLTLVGFSLWWFGSCSVRRAEEASLCLPASVFHWAQEFTPRLLHAGGGGGSSGRWWCSVWHNQFVVSVFLLTVWPWLMLGVRKHVLSSDIWWLKNKQVEQLIPTGLWSVLRVSVVLCATFWFSV